MNKNKVSFTNECDLDFIDFYEKLEKIRNEHKESFSKDKFSTEMLELIGQLSENLYCADRFRNESFFKWKSSISEVLYEIIITSTNNLISDLKNPHLLKRISKVFYRSNYKEEDIISYIIKNNFFPLVQHITDCTAKNDEKLSFIICDCVDILLLLGQDIESGLLESINKFQEKLIGGHKNEDQVQTACQKVRQIYDVFDNFIKKDAFEAFCKLRKNKALFFWENEHFKVNSKYIDDIEQYYYNIVLADTTIADYNYLFEQHEKLLFAVNRLKTFDVSPSAVKGLDNESIDTLKAYNKVITDFKDKVRDIEKCMMELVEGM